MDKKGGKAKGKKRVVAVADAPARVLAGADDVPLTEEEAREASSAAVAAAIKERQQQQQVNEEKEMEEYKRKDNRQQQQQADVAAASSASAAAAPQPEADAKPEPTPVAEAAVALAALNVEPKAPVAEDVPAAAAASVSAAPVASAAASASPAAVAAVAPAAPSMPTFSSIELLDWKVADEKGKKSSVPFVTFLFEICYRYPPELLRQLGRDLAAEGLDPQSFPPTASVVLAKRYAELYDFHSFLEKHFVCLPPFPDKTLSSPFGRRTDTEFVSGRAAALHHYLAQLLMRADIEKSGWPRQFLGAPSPAQHLRTEREKAAARKQQQQQQHAQEDPFLMRSQPRAASSSFSHAGAAAPSVPFDGAFDDSGVEVEQGGGVAITGASSLPIGGGGHLSHAIDQEDDDDEPFIGSEANSMAEAVPVSDPNHPLHKPNAQLQHDEDDFHRRLQASSGNDHTVVPLSKSPSMVVSSSAPTSLANLAPAPSLPEAYAEYAKTAPAFAPPRSAILEFSTSSGVFDMMRAILVDKHTLLILAADRSVVAKASSFFSSLFGKSKEEEKRSASETTTYTSTSGEQIANPRGALYAFRRTGAGLDDGRPNSSGSSDTAGDLIQTLSIFFPLEMTEMRWDAERRWIYLADKKGQLSIFNPSSDFDYAVKILSAPVLPSAGDAAAPILAMTFAPSAPPAPGTPTSAAAMAPAGLMFACSLPDKQYGGDKQILTRFDLHEQRADIPATMQFNAPKTPNQNESLNALEWDTAQKRLLVASSGRVISLYDCATQPGAPPTLLHRLLNGHDDAVTALALDPSPQLLPAQGRVNVTGMLASGGADGAVLLWNLGLKGAERTSTIWARLKAHVAPVSALAWSAPLGSPFGIASSGNAAGYTTNQPSTAGRYLVSGDVLGHVCVWDARRRGCVMAFKAHNGAIRSLQITSTAPLTLVTASEDKSAKIWQLS